MLEVAQDSDEDWRSAELKSLADKAFEMLQQHARDRLHARSALERLDVKGSRKTSCGRPFFPSVCMCVKTMFNINSRIQYVENYHQCIYESIARMWFYRLSEKVQKCYT